MRPRGLRLNNPCNIRLSADKFQGEIQPSGDKEFKQFKDAPHGYRAAFVIIRTYMTRYGLDTIRGIIRRWAPPSDGNHTENYIKAVAAHAGIHADEKLDFGDREAMLRVVAAMSYVENGEPAEMGEVVKGWELV